MNENSISQAVELWLVDKAVLPIENSFGGSVHRNYDLLLRHRLHIVGEVKLQVNHCLLGLPSVKLEEIKRVFSHPQVGQKKKKIAITFFFKNVLENTHYFLTHSYGSTLKHLAPGSGNVHVILAKLLKPNTTGKKGLQLQMRKERKQRF